MFKIKKHRILPTATQLKREMLYCRIFTISLLLVSLLICSHCVAALESINDPRKGKIDDVTCHIEELEEANDSQLFTILHDLKQTEFFRNFAVDLSATCPLSWNKHSHSVQEEKGQETKSSSSSSSSVDKGLSSNDDAKGLEQHFTGHSEGEKSSFMFTPFGGSSVVGVGGGGGGDGTCAGSLEDMDPDQEESACHVELGDDESSTSGGDFKMESTLETNAKEPDFECDGGTISHEVDEDAPPLCELTESEMTEYYNANESKTPLKDLLSSALNALNKKMRWDSPSQEKTFMWSKKTDPVVLSTSTEEACDDEAVEGRLPDTFWLDMCAHIQEGDGMKVADLTLNPERNTGYNGTHIWRAIYEENCIDLDGYVDQPMCYEERVMYRLLSGLHASTTLSIAKNYYPPNKRKGRTHWEPNAVYFYEKFGDHPEYIRNMHFSYVVLLRALRKAYPVLSKYEIRTGNIVDDETAMILLRRLLDSSILKSCSQVFAAFDESLMFRQDINVTSFHDLSQNKFPIDTQKQVVTLQQNFKGVFHNISSILDCVQCQQCKLHGKMAMLGYGTALKILFMTNDELIASSLSRNEIVAFINTIAKMSEALKDVRDLTDLYWSQHMAPSSVPIQTYSDITDGSITPLDAAIGATAALANSGMIDSHREAELVRLALEGDEALLVIAKHYSSNLEKFLAFTEGLSSAIQPDAIVVGTGLAGLAASLHILDRGGSVLIIEKEHRLGGNSNKASSGINACCPNNSTTDDYLENFIADTTKSAGAAARPELIQTLASNSAEAVTWLKERVGVDLSLISQLGGHRSKRTHRPKNGMVGAEVIYGMQKAVKEYEKTGRVQILTDTKVVDLLRDDQGKVKGVAVEYLSKEKYNGAREIFSQNVILATGGFAADRSDGSYLSKYRPELLKMPATAGPFSTGDGIGLATAVGAGIIDMEKIQIHPTGWVDPKDPTNPNKILAAELMRGVGGILINSRGERFCNELGTRAYVTDMMLSHDSYYAEHKEWNKGNDIPTFSLVLSSAAASDGKKHVDHYVHKGLLTKLDGIRALSDWMGIDVSVIRETLTHYVTDAEGESDKWGKTSFQGLPSKDFDNEVFFAGTVTPVLHYCMGGITIDTEGNVLDENKRPIPGLHAAGEVTGGVHGDNRLGGNSLLECTVFGTIVGKKIPIRARIDNKQQLPKEDAKIKPKSLDEIKDDVLVQHSSNDDCWVAIHGYVYDLTNFAEEHPAGAESIYNLCGTDGTGAFQAVHNKNMLDDFEDDKVGRYALSSTQTIGIYE